MTKDQAITAMKQGHKVRHSGFTSEEWMMRDGASYIFEDGIRCTEREFWRFRTEEYWNKGWSID